MGLTNWRGDGIRKADVGVAKNYLTAEELSMLNLIVDQYLSFAELQARQRRPMYMRDWIRKLDDFLKLNDREILDHAGKVSAALSEEMAQREFEKFSVHQRQIEADAAVKALDREVIDAAKARRKPKSS
jgi:hypothetical protein